MLHVDRETYCHLSQSNTYNWTLCQKSMQYCITVMCMQSVGATLSLDCILNKWERQKSLTLTDPTCMRLSEQIKTKQKTGKRMVILSWKLHINWLCYPNRIGLLLIFVPTFIKLNFVWVIKNILNYRKCISRVRSFSNMRILNLTFDLKRLCNPDLGKHFCWIFDPSNERFLI